MVIRRMGKEKWGDRMSCLLPRHACLCDVNWRRISLFLPHSHTVELAPDIWRRMPPVCLGLFTAPFFGEEEEEEE